MSWLTGKNKYGHERKLKKARAQTVLLVLIVTAGITAFELKNSYIDHNFAAILYLLLLMIAALLWDYAAAIVALIAGTVALDYIVPPLGFDFGVITVRKLVLFVIAGVIICVLSWRSRALQLTNEDLLENANSLQKIVRRLTKRAKNDEQELAKLTKLNRQLDKLVSTFLEDESYWQKRLETSVSDLSGEDSSRGINPSRRNRRSRA